MKIRKIVILTSMLCSYISSIVFMTNHTRFFKGGIASGNTDATGSHLYINDETDKGWTYYGRDIKIHAFDFSFDSRSAIQSTTDLVNRGGLSNITLNADKSLEVLFSWKDGDAHRPYHYEFPWYIQRFSFNICVGTESNSEYFLYHQSNGGRYNNSLNVGENLYIYVNNNGYGGWFNGDKFRANVYCGGPSSGYTYSQPTYTLSLNINGTGSGTVYGAGTYLKSQKVDITATQGSGSNFIKWSDGDYSSSRTIEMFDDITLTATFNVIQMFTVTFKNEDGTETLYSETVLEGQNISIAVPNKPNDSMFDYIIYGWVDTIGGSHIANLNNISSSFTVYAKYDVVPVYNYVILSNSSTHIRVPFLKNAGTSDEEHYIESLTLNSGDQIQLYLGDSLQSIKAGLANGNSYNNVKSVDNNTVEVICDVNDRSMYFKTGLASGIEVWFGGRDFNEAEIGYFYLGADSANGFLNSGMYMYSWLASENNARPLDFPGYKTVNSDVANDVCFENVGDRGFGLFKIPYKKTFVDTFEITNESGTFKTNNLKITEGAYYNLLSSSNSTGDVDKGHAAAFVFKLNQYRLADSLNYSICSFLHGDASIAKELIDEYNGLSDTAKSVVNNATIYTYSGSEMINDDAHKTNILVGSIVTTLVNHLNVPLNNVLQETRAMTSRNRRTIITNSIIICSSLIGFSFITIIFIKKKKTK